MGKAEFALGKSEPKDEAVDDDAEKKEHQKTKMKIAIGSLLSYFVIGWYAYCWGGKDWGVEEMTFTDATYFLMVTLTVRLGKHRVKQMHARHRSISI